jgi:hypothetical protein
MKKYLVLLIVFTCLSGCKKNDNYPNNYLPKKGDSVGQLISNWGEPNEKVYVAKSFNDDADFYYYSPISQVVRVSERIIVSVQKIK